MTEPVLEVHGLQKYFPVSTGSLLQRKIGWVKAVEAVDFAIQPGETLGLIGESGLRQDDHGEADPAAGEADRGQHPCSTARMSCRCKGRT